MYTTYSNCDPRTSPQHSIAFCHETFGPQNFRHRFEEKEQVKM